VKTWGQIVRGLVAYLILCIGIFLMLRTIVDYTSFRTDIHFLKFKQAYLHIPWWKVAFYVHVFSSIFALAAGLTQFSSYLREQHRKIHRFIGKLYVINILVINFPAALIMAVYANGLLPSKIAFFILDVLWFLFTYKALRAAQQKRITEHQEFMIRSYALTFSAITLRTWKIILFNAFHPDPITLYMIDAWMGFVPNLLVAEWLIWRMRTGKRLFIFRSKNRLHVLPNTQSTQDKL
jgi:uncharacterized membrane protein